MTGQLFLLWHFCWYCLVKALWKSEVLNKVCVLYLKYKRNKNAWDVVLSKPLVIYRSTYWKTQRCLTKKKQLQRYAFRNVLGQNIKIAFQHFQEVIIIWTIEGPDINLLCVHLFIHLYRPHVRIPTQRTLTVSQSWFNNYVGNHYNTEEPETE